MPQNPFTKPANRILISPANALVAEFEVGANATAAEMIPGAVVINDTNAQDVKESGDEPHAVVGILECAEDMLYTDHYAVGDQCPVIMGPAICQVRLKASENISIGDRLRAMDNGLAAELATGVIGAQGATIGYALEASNVAAIAYITIMFLPSVEAQTAA